VSKHVPVREVENYLNCLHEKPSSTKENASLKIQKTKILNSKEKGGNDAILC